MCKYCLKHAGEFKKWYLNPENFGAELFYKLSFVDRIMGREPLRARKMEEASDAAWYSEDIAETLDTVDKISLPILGKMIGAYGNWLGPRSHAGQVVPLEDALQIAEIAEGHVLLPCMCYQLFRGEDYYKCLNFFPVKEFTEKSLHGWNMKPVSRGEAEEKLREFDEQGFVHCTLWYYGIPYVLCVCNCDAKYCYAARPRLWYGVQNAYRKSEYVAGIDQELCTQCGKCLSRCQFGAIFVGDRVEIDYKNCFGCGLCRNACEEDAIKLSDRNVHAARNLW